MNTNMRPTAEAPCRICLTVDMEGDAAENRRSTFLGIEQVLPGLRQVLARRGIKATFFVQEDRICRAGSRFRALLGSLEGEGHEIGYHAHGLIQASADERAEIIGLGLRRLKDLGFAPESFRGGRFYLSGPLLRVLEDNGIKYDSSVVPGLREHFPDGTVRCDHVDAPDRPYVPSYEDHRREGDSRILEIPINRYPHLPAASGGVLKGTEDLEEVLFDYFHETRKDRIIVVDIHSWDGLSAILKKVIRRESDGLIRKMLLGFLGKAPRPGRLMNGAYAGRLEALLAYMARTDDVRFATIKDAGLSLRKTEEQEKR